ncbi:MAG TPA: translocation/assembly module TamB domain-containing protein, partial [Leptolyngbyaceae cyanobacterium]
LNGEVGLDPEDETPRTLGINAANVPLASLRKPLRLPSSIQGSLSANASVTGSPANPQLRGVIGLANTTINNNPIQSAQANFLYQDARLRLQSSLVVDSPDDPLTLSASIPYRLPFAKQQPASSDLAVDIDVRDEGIALLNLFNRAVSWESGKGAVNLTVRGNWEDGSAPDITTLAGTANFEDATVRAEVLPEPLTNIDGQIRFQQDRIIVEKLTGEFSKGNLFAQGALPLLNPIQTEFDPDPEAFNTAAVGAEIARSANAGTDSTSSLASVPAEPGTAPQPDAPIGVADTPLTLNAENIALNFKGIYNGQVNGQIQVGGSIFLYGPIIHGSVVLSQGRLSLPNGNFSDLSTQPVVASSSKRGGTFTPLPPSLDDLSLFLDDDIRIIVPGIVDVAAQGGISVNGIFPALEPTGRIRLPSGRVNLVTTQFRLSGDDNYAEFRPTLGLEPYLKATLRAAVPASSGNATTLVQGTFFPGNEVSDAPVDRLGFNQTGVETVRIQAQVEGPVSQVADLRGVTLTSTPSRSESEIISLISGGFFTALESTLGTVGGSGDSFQGLIALAGTALLNNIQDVLGSALNLSELRLYTTTDARGVQGTNNSLDFGGEIGFALSPSISVSIQKTFTTITPAQFNVRYRLSDQFTVRGTTSYENFRESSGLLLEYESRF